jgi:hypothetical protein
LAGNVTLSGSNNWTPIGTDSAPFNGTFDGQGYTITNLNIKNTAGDYQGMFGEIRGGVRNLGLANVSITGNTYVGGVAGRNNGTIQNCYTTGTVKGADTHVGGLAGENYGEVWGCYSTANVEGRGYTGGIAGSNTGVVRDCYTTGTVNSINLGFAGGVTGINNSSYGVILFCYATGTVSGGNGNQSNYAGGVVGNNSNTAGIRHTVALGRAVCTEWNYIGRITGEKRGELVGNYARDSMVVSYKNGGNKRMNPGLDTEDGANITAAQWNTASWWTSAGNWSTTSYEGLWDTSVWDIANNRLPRLRNMPAGTQNPVVQ